MFSNENGTVRMYLRGRPIILYAPSAIAEQYDLEDEAPKPSKKLELEWAYGYRGRDCRSNLYVLPTGEIVYFIAAVGVLCNVDEYTQRHYIGHTDDIRSLAVHPNNVLIATGQCAGHDKSTASPHIRIWDSNTLETKVVIQDDFVNAVGSLTFSKTDDGVLLAAIDESVNHVLSIWDWEKQHKITEHKSSKEAIATVEFHPVDENVLITCGKSHVGFWTLSEDGLTKKLGIFGQHEKPKFVNCIAFLESGEVVTGDSNGNVAVWERDSHSVSKMLENIHDGSVFNICVLKNGSVITGGGKDGTLKYFDSNFEPTGDDAKIDSIFGGIRMIAEGNDGNLILGTTRNGIFTYSTESGFDPIQTGHSDELWALATHPNKSQFVTAGLDKHVKIWDADTKRNILFKELEEQAQSAAFSPDGSTVAVGCLTGKWFLLNSESLEIVAEYSDGDEPIQVIQYSPNGDKIAIGSRDNHVYLYEKSDGDEYTKLGRCVGHSSYITHIDWSADGQHLRTNSGDYELLYWNAESHAQITHSQAMRDEEWASNTCTITFNTVGIWPPDADGTDVNACDRSHNSELLASVDDFGKVNLYAYPVSQPKARCRSYIGHCSHVTNAAFLHDDTKLITTGGKDTSVLQWRVV